MKLVLVGLNHETAPVSLRERVSIPLHELPDLLPVIQAACELDELVLLSTCNRTELIACAGNPEAATEKLSSFLADHAGMGTGEIRPHLYTFVDMGVVEHLFRVAAGLESMVLGEPQIAGQVKDAFDAAIEIGTARTRLVNLYRHTLQTVKQVRSETGIARNAVSVSYAAVELARKVFGELRGRRALLIGAGEMCELAATHLKERGVDAVDVVNRTVSKAEELAARFGGNPFPLAELYQALQGVDIVVSSTGSADPIVQVDMMQEAMSGRRAEPMLLIDIAVPRDIDPKVGSLDNVFLFDIDDMNQVIAANLEKRRKEAERAGQLVRKRVREYEKWVRVQDVNPVIVSLRKQAEEMRRAELEKSLRKLKDCPEEIRKEMDRLSYAIVNKMLHQPITELKRVARDENLEHGLMSFFKSMFKLD